MLEQLKQWFASKTTVIIHINSGRHRLLASRSITIGNGSGNRWNLDPSKPPSRILEFRRSKSGLKVEPTNPEHRLYVDGKPWNDDFLDFETEYTLQIQTEQFLLCVTRKPKAWRKKIDLKTWLVFEPATGETFGPLDKLQLEPWVIAELKDPNELIYYPKGSAKGFFISQVVDMELPAAKTQKEVIEQQAREARPYSSGSSPSAGPQAQCPHCWTPYEEDQLLAIASHESLRGDPHLGEDEMLRFEPMQFDPNGIPLDTTGTPCLERACPQCRLKIPHGLSDIPQAFISIIGSPGAGKSYYLSVLVETVQRLAFDNWRFGWKDADPTANAPLNAMRHRLFTARYASDALLAKTALDGHLYSKVVLNGRSTLLPKPFTYILEGTDQNSQCLTFYDNAGEHFQPGSDGTTNPVTHHLAHAHLWCFLFDPAKDVAFRKNLTAKRDPQLSRNNPTESQELILAELENRIRVLHQLPPLGKLNTPLAFVIGKKDIIRDWEPITKLSNPWNGRHFSSMVVEENSRILREGLLERVPNLVARAESLSEKVVYFASTSFGHAPRKIKTGELSPIPKKMDPYGVEVPVFWWLTSWSAVFNPQRQEEWRNS